MFDNLYEIGQQTLDIAHYAIVAAIPLVICTFPFCFVIHFVKHFRKDREDEC